MAIVVKSGVKRDHRSKKNGASREEYLRRNREENEQRTPQEVSEIEGKIRRIRAS